MKKSLASNIPGPHHTKQQNLIKSSASIVLFFQFFAASQALASADAGPDQTVGEETAVTLEGSNSSDPDQGDGIKSYRWKQVAGPSVTLSDPTSDQPIFEAPSLDDTGDKPLVFELKAPDNARFQSSDSTTVSVSNFEKKNPGASGGNCFIATASNHH